MAINPEQYSKIGIEEAETRACTARVEEFKRVWEQLPSNIKQEVFAPDSAIGEFSADIRNIIRFYSIDVFGS